MKHEGPPIDWDTFYHAGKDGWLMELLATLPRERWAEQDKNGFTLLHYACRGPNVAAVAALVRCGLVDVNARAEAEGGRTPAHVSASWLQSRVLDMLCAAGADLQGRSDYGYSPMDRALGNAKEDGGETVRVLVANGVRLSTVHEDYRKCITPELEAFERGVLCCRVAVVAMLRVKRASGQLVRWDKFLLAELALCIWATRYDKGWQTAT